MTPQGEQQLLEDVAEIKRGLFGDPRLQQPGVISRLSSVEKWIDNAKLQTAKVVGVCMGVAYVVGLLWEIAKDKLFHK